MIALWPRPSLRRRFSRPFVAVSLKSARENSSALESRVGAPLNTADNLFLTKRKTILPKYFCHAQIVKALPTKLRPKYFRPNFL